MTEPARTPTRKIRLKRRDALVLAGVGAAGAAAAAGLTFTRAQRVETVRSECRFCTMHCGLLATVKGDEILEVKGDPRSDTRGFICEHGRATTEVVHGSARLRKPLIREGDAFREASWDEALTLVATKLEAVKKQHGPEALVMQTGWPFVRHPMIHLLHRFCRAFGTPNLATVASLCEASGRMGRGLVWGANYSPDLAKTKTLLVWGANPPRTAPPWAFMVTNVKKRGKLIVIDPVKTEIAAHAHLYVPIKPGTDGAFALGMARHILANNLENKEFIAAHVTGIEVLRELAQPFTPEEVARVTGCDPAHVVTAAEWFAKEGPGGVYDGLGIEHHAAGVDTVRLVSALVAMCGYADAQGMHDANARATANDPLPVFLKVEQQTPIPPEPHQKPIGFEEYPYFCAVHRQAQASLLPRAILEDKPYPVRALIVFGANPAVTTPDTNAVRKSYDKLDLLVVVDPFMSDTAELADVVLPAASFAEQKPLWWGKEAEGARAVVSPRGDSKPDAVILFALAEKLGMKAMFPWEDINAAFSVRRDAVYDPWLLEKAKPTSWPPGPAPRFPTASGKIEIESSLLPRFGLPGRPQLVMPEAPPAEYPLILVTGPRQRAYINSQFHQTPSITRLLPSPRMRVHPKTAQAHKIEDSTQVVVVTEKGRARFLAEVTSEVVEGVVVVPNGWPKEASANLLTTPVGLDPLSGFPRLRSLCCRVERA